MPHGSELGRRSHAFLVDPPRMTVNNAEGSACEQKADCRTAHRAKEDLRAKAAHVTNRGIEVEYQARMPWFRFGGS